MARRGSIYIQKLAKLSMRNEIDTQDEDKLSSASIFYASMYILYHHVCIFVRDIFSFELMKYIMMNKNFQILRCILSIKYAKFLGIENVIMYKCYFAESYITVIGVDGKRFNGKTHFHYRKLILKFEKLLAI